jgi:Leucine-rich repeat (LRR) protein
LIRFTSFPDVFLFKDLNELFLNGNQITTLPARIGELKNLRVLYLTGNQIQEIPSEIGFLENLEKLSIANNAVKVIPAELGNLGRLEGTKNPLISYLNLNICKQSLI